MTPGDKLRGVIDTALAEAHYMKTDPAELTLAAVREHLLSDEAVGRAIAAWFEHLRTAGVETYHADMKAALLAAIDGDAVRGT